jgi:hypothetical protein
MPNLKRPATGHVNAKRLEWFCKDNVYDGSWSQHGKITGLSRIRPVSNDLEVSVILSLPCGAEQGRFWLVNRAAMMAL